MNEQEKYEVIKELVDHNGNKNRASKKLGISRRQIDRLIIKYKEKGKSAFIHGNRSKKPINALDKSISEDIILLYKNKYQDWNFNHFKEFLKKDENICVSYDFIYKTLTKAGILSPKARKKTKREFKKKQLLNEKKINNAMSDEQINYIVNHSEEYYYQIRNLDRDKAKFNRLPDYKRAARTIYLNKACFNGLYRVNSKNEFNVPFGKKSSVNTYEGQNLGIICGYFNYNDVKMLSVDFEEAVKDAKKGDFIYFDPPYDSDTSIFNSYTEEGFGKNEQVRLARVFKELSDRGCYVMLSNNKTSLISELYKDYNIYVIEANRNINSNGKKRGKVKEVIITNYENNMSFDENEG